MDDKEYQRKNKQIIGEMYIRNHGCSEHIFGTEPNVGKNMFGTFMFGTKINFGQKWNI